MSDSMNTIDGLLRNVALKQNNQVALVDAPNRSDFFDGNSQRWTWSEVNSIVQSLATQLHTRGIKAGSAVGIQLPNVCELVFTILACIRVGAIAVPFPIQHRNHELRSGLSSAQIQLFVTANRSDRTDQIKTVAALLAEFKNIQLATFGGDEEETNLHLTPDPSDSGLYHHAEPNDIATICWTSGTTGMPKGVPRTNAMWLATSRVQVDELSISPSDNILCPFPVVNMAGIGGMLMPWLTVGASLFLHQPLDLTVFLTQIETEEITYTVAPPPLLNMLLRNKELLDSVNLSSIRAISSGSAPLDPWMVKGWQDRNIEIVNVFGSNEGAALLSTMRSVPDPEQRARFFPQPNRQGISIRIVDFDTGQEITESGRPGELRFTGPTVFLGYLQSAGDEFDADGYYKTGDIFQWADTDSSSRLLQFVDRAKDIIIRGGMNISAAEIEALIASHEDVLECAVVSFPDPDLGEKVGVFVVPIENKLPDLPTIVDFLRTLEIASYKLPERLEIIDALPRNAVGKVTKSDLRDRWRL
jgi:acyl-CoA synthetase